MSTRSSHFEARDDSREFAQLSWFETINSESLLVLKTLLMMNLINIKKKKKSLVVVKTVNKGYIFVRIKWILMSLLSQTKRFSEVPNCFQMLHWRWMIGVSWHTQAHYSRGLLAESWSARKSTGFFCAYINMIDLLSALKVQHYAALLS